LNINDTTLPLSKGPAATNKNLFPQKVYMLLLTVTVMCQSQMGGNVLQRQFAAANARVPRDDYTS